MDLRAFCTLVRHKVFPGWTLKTLVLFGSFGSEKSCVQKNFGQEKYFVSGRKFGETKICCLKVILCPKNIFGRKQFWVWKKVVWKKIWVETKFCVQKEFWFKKIWVWNFFLVGLDGRSIPLLLDKPIYQVHTSFLLGLEKFII